MHYESYILILSSKASSKFFILVSNAGQRWVCGTKICLCCWCVSVHLCTLKFAVGTQRGIHSLPTTLGIDHRSFFIVHTLLCTLLHNYLLFPYFPDSRHNLLLCFYKLDFAGFHIKWERWHFFCTWLVFLSSVSSRCALAVTTVRLARFRAWCLVCFALL